MKFGIIGEGASAIASVLAHEVGGRHELVVINEAGGPKTFRNWRPVTGNPNGDQAEFEVAQDRANGLMGTSSEPPARADQPSPTGNDGDLLMDPPAKPRMINGSAKKGWEPKTGEDPREECE